MSDVGKITIIAKNIKGNANGQVRYDAKKISNTSGGVFTQNGKGSGVSHDNNTQPKQAVGIKITKLEGPFDDAGKLVKTVKVGEFYTFKATPSRKPIEVEIPSLKWALKPDNKEQYQVNGAGIYNRLIDGKIVIKLRMPAMEEKVKVYAFYNKPSESVSVEVKKVNEAYLLFYSEGNKRGDEMFKAAAYTRKMDIENSGLIGKNDKIIIKNFKDLYSLKHEIESESENFLIKEIDIWSHAGKDGPTGTSLTSSYALDSKQMKLEGWKTFKINWSDSSEMNFFGCKTGMEDKSFSKNISALPNFKDVIVSGQTNSGYPSQFVNYRNNSENGSDNFINSEKDGVINFQITYLVAGIGRSEDWNLNEQNVALKMQRNKNGTTIGKEYQKGKHK